MAKTKPPKRQPPTKKRLIDYLKVHGHKDAEIVDLSNAKNAKETKDAITELHKAKKSIIKP